MAAIRAGWEAERATMVANGEEDIGPFGDADWPPVTEGFTQAEAIAHTRASILAALAVEKP